MKAANGNSYVASFYLFRPTWAFASVSFKSEPATMASGSARHSAWDPLVPQKEGQATHQVRAQNTSSAHEVLYILLAFRQQ